jgi:hypothetical protein
MQRLQGVGELVVTQKKDWGEIFADLEQGNRYVVLDAGGRELFFAAETGGSVLTRWFLRSFRPFEIRVLDADRKPVLRLRRPFKFYFTELHASDAGGRNLGRVQRRFSLLRRVYAVFDATGRETHQLFGPLLHPWTFEVRRDGLSSGKIVKRWGGLLREGFTKADGFGVLFPAGATPETKALLLGATFLIDFAHFEQSR